MGSAVPLSRLDPRSLPHVWRVNDLAAEAATVPTGSPLLDRVLPGGGWPQGGMVEVLQQRPGQHAWQLVLPGLSHAVAQCAGPVVLVGAPYQPFGPNLQAQGFPVERLLCVHAEKSAPRLWAAEQALRCAEVAAVLAWVPEARADELRRLQLSAQQQRRLLFVFRFARSRHEASPATLRLLVEGQDSLQVHVLKRRGPPLLQPVELPAFQPRLAALLQARRKGRALPAPAMAPSELTGGSHVLDRAAA
jgi:protein ImuA